MREGNLNDRSVTPPSNTRSNTVPRTADINNPILNSEGNNPAVKLVPYKVQRGDNMREIAAELGITVEEIKAANPDLVYRHENSWEGYNEGKTVNMPVHLDLVAKTSGISSKAASSNELASAPKDIHFGGLDFSAPAVSAEQALAITNSTVAETEEQEQEGLDFTAPAVSPEQAMAISDNSAATGEQETQEETGVDLAAPAVSAEQAIDHAIVEEEPLSETGLDPAAPAVSAEGATAEPEGEDIINAAPAFIKYIVQPREHLKNIAARFGVTSEAIIAANPNGHYITTPRWSGYQEYEEILIPNTQNVNISQVENAELVVSSAAEESVAVAESSTTTTNETHEVDMVEGEAAINAAPTFIKYTVQPGEHLKNIAARFGVTSEAIIAANPNGHYITTPRWSGYQKYEEILIPNTQTVNVSQVENAELVVSSAAEESVGVDVNDQVAEEVALEYNNEDFPEIVPGALTFDAEGGNNGVASDHALYTRKPHWPGDNSGVTIGIGFDLGHYGTPAETKAVMEKVGIDKSEYAGAFGLKAKFAKAWVKNNRNKVTEITVEQQQELYKYTYAQKTAVAKKGATKDDVIDAYGVTDWENLHPAIKEVLIDMAYRGDYKSKTRVFLQRSVVANDVDAFYIAVEGGNFGNLSKGRQKARLDFLIPYVDPKILWAGKHEIMPWSFMSDLEKIYHATKDELVSQNEDKYNAETGQFEIGSLIRVPGWKQVDLMAQRQGNDNREEDVATSEEQSVDAMVSQDEFISSISSFNMQVSTIATESPNSLFLIAEHLQKTNITEGVGEGGVNKPVDVYRVQIILLHLGLLSETAFDAEVHNESFKDMRSQQTPIPEGELKETIAAIYLFQQEVIDPTGWSPDGNIGGPGSGTLKAMKNHTAKSVVEARRKYYKKEKEKERISSIVNIPATPESAFSILSNGLGVMNDYDYHKMSEYAVYNPALMKEIFKLQSEGEKKRFAINMILAIGANDLPNLDVDILKYAYALLKEGSGFSWGFDLSEVQTLEQFKLEQQTIGRLENETFVHKIIAKEKREAEIAKIKSLEPTIDKVKELVPEKLSARSKGSTLAKYAIYNDAFVVKSLEVYRPEAREITLSFLSKLGQSNVTLLDVGLMKILLAELNGVEEAVGWREQLKGEIKANKELSDVAKNLKLKIKESESKKNNHARSRFLVNYLRGQLNYYPSLVKAFKEQKNFSIEEKLKVLGEVAFEAAKMEFLLGTIFYEGEKWERNSKGGITENSGEFVDVYSIYTNSKETKSVAPWCAKFVGYIYSNVLGTYAVNRGDAAEKERGVWGGSQLSNGHEEFWNYDKTHGGRFAGAKKLGDDNVWATLRLNVRKASSKEVKKQLVLDFFEKNFTPQTGDIMIVTGREDNSFKYSKHSKFDASHTTMIEKLDTSGDDLFIYTIEGNAGDMVTGHKYDLLNATGSHSLSSIINISRMSMSNHGESTSLRKKKTPEDLAVDKQKSIYTRNDLVKPIKQVNKILTDLGKEIGEGSKVNWSGRTVNEFLNSKSTKTN